VIGASFPRHSSIPQTNRAELRSLASGRLDLLESLSRDDYQDLYEKSKVALLARDPNALRSAPKTIENLIEQGMIRGLQN
jgi:hypothetical protein